MVPRNLLHFLIGTHLDKAKDADIQQIEKEIKDSLRGKAFFEKDILAQYHCLVKKVRSLLYTLDNMNGNEEEISTLREIFNEYHQGKVSLRVFAYLLGSLPPHASTQIRGERVLLFRREH